MTDWCPFSVRYVKTNQPGNAVSHNKYTDEIRTVSPKGGRIAYTLDREKLRFAVYDEYSHGSGPETVKERDSWYGG